MQFEERQRSSEGFDMSFATNTLGQLALTVQLLPALAASAPSRVLMVSSGGMYTGEPAMREDSFALHTWCYVVQRSQVSTWCQSVLMTMHGWGRRLAGCSPSIQSAHHAVLCSLNKAAHSMHQP